MGMTGKRKILYHGSRVPDLTTLVPSPHNAVGKRSVVFATPDARFALAMIHGTGDELAVGSFVDAETGSEEMYIHELRPGALKLLDAPGYLYEVDAEGFRKDPALSHAERIKDAPAEVIGARRVESVLKELERHDIAIVRYEDVPEAMRRLGKEPKGPERPHGPERFKDAA